MAETAPELVDDARKCPKSFQSWSTSLPSWSPPEIGKMASNWPKSLNPTGWWKRLTGELRSPPCKIWIWAQSWTGQSVSPHHLEERKCKSKPLGNLVAASARKSGLLISPSVVRSTTEHKFRPNLGSRRNCSGAAPIVSHTRDESLETVRPPTGVSMRAPHGQAHLPEGAGVSRRLREHRRGDDELVQVHVRVPVAQARLRKAHLGAKSMERDAAMPHRLRKA